MSLPNSARARHHIRGLTKMKKGGKADGGDKFAKGFFGNRATKNVAGRAKNVEARIEKILTEEKIEKPKSSLADQTGFRRSLTHQSKDVLITESLSIGYAPNNPLLEDLNLYIRAGQRIGLTGANGTGKTTLIRTIAGKLRPLAGNLRLGHDRQTWIYGAGTGIAKSKSECVADRPECCILDETEARNFLHYFLFKGDDALRPTSATFVRRTRPSAIGIARRAGMHVPDPG